MHSMKFGNIFSLKIFLSTDAFKTLFKYGGSCDVVYARISTVIKQVWSLKDRPYLCKDSCHIRQFHWGFLMQTRLLHLRIIHMHTTYNVGGLKLVH